MLKALDRGVHWLARACQFAWKGTERLAKWGDHPHTQKEIQDGMHCRGTSFVGPSRKCMASALKKTCRERLHRS